MSDQPKAADRLDTVFPGLAGRRVLITGASGGIGRAAAAAFAAAGAIPLLTGRNHQELERTAQLCRGRAQIRSFDILDRVACADAVRSLTGDAGGIQVLVHGAGVSETSSFLDTTVEALRHVMAVDFESNWWLTQAVLPSMLEQGHGRVIFISSSARKVGYGQVAAYVAAKHAQLGLMRALAAEYADRSVTFNAICPYYVRTPMTERSIVEISQRTGRSPDQVARQIVTPQGRLVEPDDVARLCLFLASDACCGLNGQAINMDGGKYF